MRFSSLIVDHSSHCGTWISPKCNNGEFDYWMVLELIDMDDACGTDNDGNPRYCVSLGVVAPSQVSKEDMQRAMCCCGIQDGPEQPPLRAYQAVECLYSYGIYAQVWTQSSNNFKSLIKAAHEKSGEIEMMFGFYMDRPVNRIGSTGWEIIRGDMDSALDRKEREGNYHKKMSV